MARLSALSTAARKRTVRPASVQTRARGHMSEFAICLFVLLFLALFPLIDLLGLAMRAATIELLAHESVSQASKQETYPKALAAMQEQTASFLSSGFGRFCGLRAVSGYLNCGTDLYTVVTKIDGSGTARFGPNAGITPPIDKTSVFEFMCRCTYDVRPWVNLGCIPGLANIPGVGKTARLSFAAYRAPEFFTALQQPSASAPSTSVSVSGASNPVQGSLGSYLNQSSTGSVLPETGIGLPIWRDPQLFNQIAATGQQIVSQDVLVVHASDPWVNSGITVLPGETIWIDSRADGLWRTAPNSGRPPIDANGYSFSDPLTFYGGASLGTLVACVGALPPVKLVTVNSPDVPVTPINPPNMFPVGDTLLNHAVTIPGTINIMINNTTLYDNSGQQIVRIVITR